MQTYEEFIHETYKEPDTSKLLLQHVRVFRAWYAAQFGHDLIDQDLTNYDLQLYREQSLKGKVKPATWNSRLWALGVWVTWLGRPYLVDGVEGKDYQNQSTKHRALAENEYHHLNQTMEREIERALTNNERRIANRNWTAASLMLQAGLRVDEVAQLDWSDITLNERSGQIRVRDGKGGKERIVPANKMLRASLTRWTEYCGTPTATALFEGDGAERVTTRTLQRAVSFLGTKIGVPDLTPHWLRYTFAKRLERKGVPIEQIRDLLGHTSIETTRRYLRSSLDDLQSAVEE